MEKEHEMTIILILSAIIILIVGIFIGSSLTLEANKKQAISGYVSFGYDIYKVTKLKE